MKYNIGEKTFEVSKAMLIDMLSDAGIEVPYYADIYISVPGRGDWSNTDLDIDANTPIKISWTEEE